jgi:Lycopene cyclase protein
MHAEVESHPFENDTMLFMDWRNSHTKKYPAMLDANNELPTFLYAMPFSDNRVFLEETSLVARPGVPFADLKERLYARLNHMGIKVRPVLLLYSILCPQHTSCVGAPCWRYYRRYEGKNEQGERPHKLAHRVQCQCLQLPCQVSRHSTWRLF